jgi:hypothetical protein
MKDTRARRWLWFCALWATSVLTMLLLAQGLRWLFGHMLAG